MIHKAVSSIPKAVSSTDAQKTQSLLLLIHTVSYNKNQIMLSWGNFTVDESIYFPKFRIDNYFAENSCDDEYERRSCIRGVLRLSRKVSFYFIRYYAPTLLITTATFISSWIPASGVAPRVIINMTPFLTLVTLHNALNAEINVSYVVAMHIWMFACMFYCFTGLVVLFIAVQIDSAEMKRQQEMEKRRIREENTKLFRKFSRCNSCTEDDRRGSIAIEEKDDVHNCKLKQSFSFTPNDSVWKNLRNYFVHLFGIFREKLVCCFREARNGKRKRYVNIADRIARPLVPISFAIFVTSYFLFFHDYSERKGDVYRS